MHDWMQHARCRDEDPNVFAPRSEAHARDIIATYCEPCPVSVECGAYALDLGIRHLVYGAMTPRTRRSILRQARKAVG